MSSNVAELTYKSHIFTRYDDNGYIKYFDKDDFPELMATKYSFKSSLGHNLCGYFYSYEGANKLIIFEHGLGGGHKSYFMEIQRLCAMGYVVFAYDHTGAMESEGDSVRGYAQSLCDLNDCLISLKADTTIDTSHITVVGHSMGGYSALNILALHSDIKKIVVLSGYISVDNFIEHNYKDGFQHIMQHEEAMNPKYVNFNAVKTLKDTKIPLLLIYSDNDPIVDKKLNFDPLYDSLRDNSNVHFMLLTGKGHNPHYTHSAVEYLGKLNIALSHGIPKTDEEKEQFKNSFHWIKMTEQDESVWKTIELFLK